MWAIFTENGKILADKVTGRLHVYCDKRTAKQILYQYYEVSKEYYPYTVEKVKVVS